MVELTPLTPELSSLNLNNISKRLSDLDLLVCTMSTVRFMVKLSLRPAEDLKDPLNGLRLEESLSMEPMLDQLFTDLPRVSNTTDFKSAVPPPLLKATS